MCAKLFVNKFYIKSESESDENVNEFNAKNVMNIKIDSTLNCVEKETIPRLVLPEIKTKLNIDLCQGFRETIRNKNLITDYDKYRNNKWIQFIKTIERNDLIREEKPHFVSFGGIVSDILMAVYIDRKNSSKIFGLKFKDVIYLYNKPNLDLVSNINRNIGRPPFCGLRFLYLMTDRDIKDLNEFEKHFTIDSIKLNEHKLLVLNEVKAVDENGFNVDLKARQIYRSVDRLESFYREKLLEDWCVCSVRSVKSIIFGNREEWILRDIDKQSLDEIPDKCQAYWSPNKCYEFTDRMLKFIKECVNEDLVLHEFTFDYQLGSVSCERHINESNNTNEYFLPKFYTK